VEREKKKRKKKEGNLQGGSSKTGARVLGWSWASKRARKKTGNVSCYPKKKKKTL